MSTIAGATALVTGGASGIGLLVGEGLLRRGARRLVIWDVREDALVRAAESLRAGGHDVEPHRVDITRLDEVRAALGRMAEAGSRVDVLVNNAGIVVGRQFTAHSHEDIERTMAVNATAPMHLALAVLPGMIERGRGHIVNMASAAGLVSNPGMAVYCASKWAITGWSDSLRIEMERARTGVRVTTVMPYYIDTGMFAGVRSRLLPILRPEPVAREIVRAIEKDRVFLRLPRLLNLVPLMKGAMPVRLFDLVGGEWAGVYRTMDTFVGRRD